MERTYEQASLACLDCIDELGALDPPIQPELLARAQVYATLHLAEQTRKQRPGYDRHALATVELPAYIERKTNG